MIRHRIALFALAPLLIAAPAPAQEQSINIYYVPMQGAELNSLNKAIQAALSQPPMQLVAKPFAGVLVVTPGAVEVTRKKVSGTYYEFTVAFTRDGSALGESQQACNLGNLAECTDQLMQDIKSVAGAK